MKNRRISFLFTREQIETLFVICILNFTIIVEQYLISSLIWQNWSYLVILNMDILRSINM